MQLILSDFMSLDGAEAPRRELLADEPAITEKTVGRARA